MKDEWRSTSEEEGAGFGWAQDEGMLIALLFGLGGGAERVAGLFGGAEHRFCGEEIGAFGTEAEEAGNAPLVTADGVGAQTGLSEVGGSRIRVWGGRAPKAGSDGSGGAAPRR